MIKEQWNNLNERDQKTLIGGTICAVILLIYIFVYSPLISAIEQEKMTINDSIDTLTWMRQALPKMDDAIRQQKMISNTKLLSLINQQLNTNDLKSFSFQLQQGNNQDIQISYKNVPFMPFIKWLWSLDSQYRVQIKQLNVEKLETTGTVKLSLTLSTPS
jgi:general secretion pathway protein M